MLVRDGLTVCSLTGCRAARQQVQVQGQQAEVIDQLLLVQLVQPI